MPDHVHILAHGRLPDADLCAFVVHYKKLTGFAYRQRTKKWLWQPGYYERILRDDESTEGAARYILENPVRAGLTRRLGEYPFAGSELYDLPALLTAWDSQG
jgi:REP element-mobilizing transposase RayT